MGSEMLSSAINDFHRARNRAVIKELVARFTGENVNLLSFDEVRKKLNAQASASRGLQDIPLEAIVGSVNRYDDFTRDFLPRKNVEAQRWARVELAYHGLTGLDPIEVYKIGEVYFVKDGNHRVSVARQLKATHIQAYVTEIYTRAALTPQMSPDELILKAEYAAFLELTRIEEVRPEANLVLSAPGLYPKLEEHIQVHRYYLGLSRQAEPPMEEAAASWYDQVYTPVRQIIHARGILRDFPNRTEADLYLWLMEHRAALEEVYGREIKPEKAAGDLAAQFSPRRGRVVSRLGDKLRGVLPEALESGPAPGEWRREKESLQLEHLFTDILVPFSGFGSSWDALDQAILLAQREQGSIQGLHVDLSDSDPEHVPGIQEEFYRRCQQAEVPAHFMVTSGDITNIILDQARWSDITVVHLAIPPAAESHEGASWRKIIQRSSRPILAVPEVAPLEKALLAYDGSPKADEALYVATYLTGRWNIPLVVVTVFENKTVPPETLIKAQLYLEEHNQQAEMVRLQGDAIQGILNTIDTHSCDLVIMGGYGHTLPTATTLGSAVDNMLRISARPVLICR
jgi:nucleotide-binding universal stress UspA family protein